jgi:hypothetical protein
MATDCAVRRVPPYLPALRLKNTSKHGSAADDGGKERRRSREHGARLMSRHFPLFGSIPPNFGGKTRPTAAYLHATRIKSEILEYDII